MVGLRLLLEAKKNPNKKHPHPQVIYKTISIKPTTSFPPPPPPPPPPLFSTCSSFGPPYHYSACPTLPAISFLDACFLCKKKLLPEKDIYMYKGDRAFCSVECRYRHILMDEEENLSKEKSPLVAMKPKTSTSTNTSTTPSVYAPRYQRKNRMGMGGGYD